MNVCKDYTKYIDHDFGHWHVLQQVRIQTKNQIISGLRCRCSCGKIRDIPVHNLLSHKTTQCIACSNKDRAKKPDAKYNHPLYETWRRLHKMGLLCPEWHNNFWAYINGIGDAAPGSHIYRDDPTKPLGPGNFKWYTKDEIRQDITQIICKVTGRTPDQLEGKSRAWLHYLLKTNGLRTFTARHGRHLTTRPAGSIPLHHQNGTQLAR